MEFLLILCGASLALGLFFIAADLFKLPRLATQKALLSAGRQEKKQARTTDVLLMGWAVKLAPHIHMDEYKHSRLKNTLNAAGLGMTPEEYTAFAIVKAAAVMLGVIPCLFLFPLLALVVILLAVMVYFKEIRRADEKLSGKRDEIESELPRFVATITQELANSRDVLSMVEHYKQNAGATFAAELDILTADMRSGSYEAALTRFEARFNSPLLSDVVRGLIGVLRGDDGVHYGEGFDVLSTDIITSLQGVDIGSAASSGVFGGIGSITSPIMVIFIIIMMGYAIIKCFFSNLKRGGILLIQIAVGSLYMFSVPRGYMDGFVQWCKQIIGLCLTTFLQATILTAGLMVLKDHALLGLGLMLSAGEVPRICGAFGLDTSTRANIMSAVYAAQTAVNTTRTVVQTVGAAAK